MLSFWATPYSVQDRVMGRQSGKAKWYLDGSWDFDASFYTLDTLKLFVVLGDFRCQSDQLPENKKAEDSNNMC
jgi:hypothetical protein